jgi:uncharacterized protein (TIGR03067 family)
MRRIVCLLAGVLLVVASLGSDSPKEYDGAAEAADLEGSWQQVGAVWNGQLTVTDAGCVRTYRNGRETTHDDGRLVGDCPFTVDTSSRPARMDTVETAGKHKGKTWRHIYRVEGDTLRMTHGGPGEERPRSFENRDTYLGIYKRVKK